MRLPHTIAPEWPKSKPGRYAATIRRDEPEGCRVALLGLPDDTGVRLNGGRPGAAAGPAAFRAELASFGTPWDGLRARRLDVGVFDAGDVEPAQGADERALYETHERVRAACAALHELGLVPICIGGGHDLSLPSITALAQHSGAALGGINLDAHLDVRERVGSGMPFRRLIEAGSLDPKRFVELGVGRFANDERDVTWLSALGARLVPVEHAMAEFLPAEHLAFALGSSGVGFVSIDLDALDASVVPGVSALNPLGLGVAHAASLAEAAGREAKVLHFDVMELCPAEDVARRSARVAALLVLSFLAGFEERGR